MAAIAFDDPDTGLPPVEAALVDADSYAARLKHAGIDYAYGDCSGLDEVFARPELSTILARIELGLAGREHHYPSQLSGGQQQRVAIARAIVNDPLLLLADEPTGNLDDQSSRELMEVFVALNRQGKTIVMITHETDIAAYAKRMVMLRDGNVVDVGAVR